MLASLGARKQMSQETHDSNTPLQRLVFWYELGCNKDQIIDLISTIDKHTRLDEFNKTKQSLINKARPHKFIDYFYVNDKRKSLNKLIGVL